MNIGNPLFYRITLNVYCLNQDAVKFYEAMGLKTLKIDMEKVNTNAVICVDKCVCFD